MATSSKLGCKFLLFLRAFSHYNNNVCIVKGGDSGESPFDWRATAKTAAPAALLAAATTGTFTMAICIILRTFLCLATSLSLYQAAASSLRSSSQASRSRGPGGGGSMATPKSFLCISTRGDGGSDHAHHITNGPFPPSPEFSDLPTVLLRSSCAPFAFILLLLSFFFTYSYIRPSTYNWNIKSSCHSLLP